MDYFHFHNLFGFGRISQICIIFLNIYVIQICGIWLRLFESTNQLSSFPLALIEIVVSTLPVSPSICVWQLCVHVSWCTDAYVIYTCIFVYSYFVTMCNSHSGMLQYYYVKLG